jgi:hypothetical protein
MPRAEKMGEAAICGGGRILGRSVLREERGELVASGERRP